MHELRGDVHLFAGELDAARDAYGAALALPGEERTRRVLQLKQEAAGDPALAEITTDYLGLFDIEGDGLTQGVIRLWGAHQIRALPGHEALGSYLVARQLLNVQRYAAAIPYLQDAVDAIDSLPSLEFRRAAREELMGALVVDGRYDEALAVVEALERGEDVGNGHRLDYALWRGRIAFYRGYVGTPLLKVRE